LQFSVRLYSITIIGTVAQIQGREQIQFVLDITLPFGMCDKQVVDCSLYSMVKY